MVEIGRRSRRRTLYPRFSSDIPASTLMGSGPLAGDIFTRSVHLATDHLCVCQALELLPCQRKAGLSLIDRAGLSGEFPRVSVYKKFVTSHVR